MYVQAEDGGNIDQTIKNALELIRTYRGRASSDVVSVTIEFKTDTRKFTFSDEYVVSVQGDVTVTANSQREAENKVHNSLNKFKRADISTWVDK